jgi:hypothetical protein
MVVHIPKPLIMNCFFNSTKIVVSRVKEKGRINGKSVAQERGDKKG